VEDLLAERGIDICHETGRFWWNRFGPIFAAEIRKKRVDRMKGFTHWRWRRDEVYVKIGNDPAFLSATAPASIEVYRTNAFYASQEEFVFALAEPTPAMSMSSPSGTR
jgi:hypothetical protein